MSAANQQSTISNQQSLSALRPPPSALFSVRTPTAVVTDLGTEFGVEVDASGLSRATVFQGKIEMRPAEGGSDSRRTLHLTANQSAEVQKGPDHVATIVRVTKPAERFCAADPQPRLRHQRTGCQRIPQPTGLSPDRPRHARRSRKLRRQHQCGRTGGGLLGHRQRYDACFPLQQRRHDRCAYPPRPCSTACAVNNRGQVVGDYWPNGSGNCHAFLFSAGKMTDLGLLHDGDSFGRGINDRGQVVGYSTDRKTGRSRAFLYSNGKMTDLGADSYASDINAAGQVVGYCETADKSRKHAFLYCPGAGMKDLGTLGGSVSGALRINDLGQVVGCSSAATGAGNGGRPRVSLRRRLGNEGSRLAGRRIRRFAPSALTARGKSWAMSSTPMAAPFSLSSINRMEP